MLSRLGQFETKGPCLQSKAQWVLKIERNLVIEEIAYSSINNRMGDIWRTNLNQRDIKDIMLHENFWIDVMTSWARLTCVKPNLETQIRNQIISWNSEVKTEGKMINVDTKRKK